MHKLSLHTTSLNTHEPNGIIKWNVHNVGKMIQFNASRSIRSITTRIKRLNGKAENFPTIQMHMKWNEVKFLLRATNCHVITSYCERVRKGTMEIYSWTLFGVYYPLPLFNCSSSDQALNSLTLSVYVLCFMISLLVLVEEVVVQN